MLLKNQALIEALKSLREFINVQQTHLNILEKRIEHLEQQTHPNEITKFFNNLEQQQARLELLEASVENLAQQQAGSRVIEYVNENLKRQHTRFDILEKRTNNLEQVPASLNVPEALIDNLDQQMRLYVIENITEALKKPQARLDILEKGTECLEKPQTHLEALEKHLENLEQIQIHELRNRLSHFEHALVRLNELETQFNDTELRALKIATVLPYAIRQASQPLDSQITSDADQLAKSLQNTVEKCLKQSISQDTHSFADALFPVMGPAIRQSINESFKSLIQSINQGLEQSFSWRGLTWRIEAWRSGRPFSEIILQHTLVYRIEQVFLIHRETGLLIQHLHQKGVEIGDSDAVSAMFTAIQDFTRDSFSSSKTEELDSVEIGEYTVWIERGPYVVLACVVRGTAPYKFRNLMRSTQESLHAHYGLLLQQFSGDSEPLQPCRPLLEKNLQSEMKPEAKKPLLSFQMITIFSIIFLAVVGWGYFHFEYQQRLTDYIQALQNAPGIVVVSTKRQGGKLVIYGMRDPLAFDAQKIAQHYGLSDNDVESQWTPYLDLTPQFVEQRVRQQLAPPPTVSVRVQDNVLHLSGHASKQWIEKATLTGIVVGINQLEVNELVETDQLLLAQAKRQLTLPKSVTMTVQERVLRVSGIVNPVTFKTLQQHIQNLSISPQAFADFDTNGLINAEHERRKLIQRIEKTKIRFSDNTKFMPEQETVLQTLHKDVQQLLTLSQVLHQPVRLQIIGNTDGRGSKISNQQLCQQRAQVVLNWLHRHGIEKDNLMIIPPPFIRFGENALNPSDRNVTFQINIMAMAKTGITIRVNE